MRSKSWIRRAACARVCTPNAWRCISTTCARSARRRARWNPFPASSTCSASAIVSTCWPREEQMDRVQRDVPETLERAKIAVTEHANRRADARERFRRFDPRLEPTAKHRAVSNDATFPGSRQRRRRRRFLADAPLRQLHGRRSRQSRRAFRRSLRAARRERRRQDHDHPNALRPARSDLRHDDACRRHRQHSLGRRSQPGRLHVAEVLALRRSDDSREPRVFCRNLRRAERRSR